MHYFLILSHFLCFWCENIKKLSDFKHYFLILSESDVEILFAIFFILILMWRGNLPIRKSTQMRKDMMGN